MIRYYSRIPSAAIFRQFDGNVYANIPHSVENDRIIENFDKPRMIRFDVSSFIRNGEAYVYFTGRGSAIPLKGFIPFSVTCEESAE